MKYLSWAAFYEGSTDGLYLDILLPRIIREVVTADGVDLVEVPDVPAVRLGKNGRTIEAVATEACSFKDAFDIVFIHADTGGRGLERSVGQRSSAYCESMKQMCDWPELRCITVTPKHETEAWLLADGEAVTEALGYAGKPNEVGLPANAGEAERLNDPKAVLASVLESVTGRRRQQALENIFPAIAARQNMATLRQSSSFREFENRLRICLQELRIIR